MGCRFPLLLYQFIIGMINFRQEADGVHLIGKLVLAEPEILDRLIVFFYRFPVQPMFYPGCAHLVDKAAKGAGKAHNVEPVGKGNLFSVFK